MKVLVEQKNESIQACEVYGINHTLEQLVAVRTVNKETELTTNHVKKAQGRIKLSGTTSYRIDT